jgi:hypothetical protein
MTRSADFGCFFYFLFSDCCEEIFILLRQVIHQHLTGHSHKPLVFRQKVRVSALSAEPNNILSSDAQKSLESQW